VLKRHWATLTLGCAIVASTLLLLYLSRGLTPLVDQWGYVYAYRSWSLETLLTPHNGHLMALSILLYKAMFSVFGLESQLPYQLLNYALSGLVAALLFTLIRDRVGDLLALAAAVLILFFGAGADVIMPTYAFPNLIGLATGLGALLALRREDLKGDLIAFFLLTISILAYSIGIVFAAGAIAAIAMRPSGERLRRCWVALLPLAVYVIWALWARKFHQQHLYVHNLKIIGSAVADQASAIMAGLSGLFTTPNGPPPSANQVPIRTTWGPVLVAGLAALVYWRLRRGTKLSTSAIVAIVVIATYFLILGIALNQFRNTYDTRFVYVGSVFMLLVVAELLAPYRPSRAALGTIGVVFIFSMCANVAELGDSAQYLRAQSSLVRAKLAAVKLAGTAAEGTVMVEDPPGAMNFPVAQFHELDVAFDLPAYSEGELKDSAPGARQAADEELVRVMRVEPEAVRSIVPPASARPLSIAVPVGDPQPRRRGRCVSLTPRGTAPAEALIEFDGGGIAYDAAGPVEVAIGRFSDLPSVPLQARAGANRIEVAPTEGRTRWKIGIKATAPTVICPAAA
jgi:hypothetical protein